MWWPASHVCWCLQRISVAAGTSIACSSTSPLLGVSLNACPADSPEVPLQLPGADWGAGKHDAGHWTLELLSCPAVTGPILGPSVPAGAATGNLAASYSHYDALEVSEAGSSRGDVEEGFVSSEKARPRVPWYKDCQVRRLIRHPAVHLRSMLPHCKQCSVSRCP